MHVLRNCSTFMSCGRFYNPQIDSVQFYVDGLTRSVVSGGCNGGVISIQAWLLFFHCWYATLFTSVPVKFLNGILSLCSSTNATDILQYTTVYMLLG